MTTPIEMQPTIEYSGAASIQSASWAEGVSEVRAVGPSVVAANADDGNALPGREVGHQQVSLAETHKYPPMSYQEPAETYFQPQPQPPPYAAAVQLQQPMTSATTAYPWDHQVSVAQGVAATGTTTAAASASGGTTVWMPMPLVMTLCPPGLEYLTELSQLNFEDELVAMPIGLTARERRRIAIFSRRFNVRNTQGQQIYLADARMSMTLRQMVIAFVDSAGKTLMTITFNRTALPFCYVGTCGSCLLNGTVEAPPGNVVGTVEQRSPGGSLSFVIRSAEGSPVLYLEAPDPCCICLDCKEAKPKDSAYDQFAIFSLDYEHMVGKMEAQQALNLSYSQRQLSNVTLYFPRDLDVKVKATLAGATAMLHCFFFGLYGRGNVTPVSYRNHRTGPSNSIFDENISHVQNHSTNHQSSHAHHSTSHHHSHH